MNKRKVCVVINSRANYARIKSFMAAAKSHPNLELQIIVGASALLYRYGEVINVIKNDGFDINSIIYSIVEGENPVTMAKSVGLGTIELATHLENLKPDVVLTVADRFETIATAIAASYMNIPVAHTQGGEITGSIDENVRHAVTKLSHIHFPATERATAFIEKLGEQKDTIFFTGCPSIDILCETDLSLDSNLFTKYKGVGSDLDTKKPYVVVMQHPVTTEYGQSFEQINHTLKAVNRLSELNLQVVWLWPNVDAGSDDVAKGIRNFREKFQPKHIHFFRNFSAEDYAKLINNSLCIIGNSSSGLREGAYLGIPSVNIGTRQSGRERAVNVVDADYDSDEIYQAITHQLKHGRYPSSKMFGSGNSGKNIAEILASVDFKLVKKINYLN